MGVNLKGVVNSPDPSQGIFQIDLEIHSTLAAALQVELFNPASSQLKIANAAINTYQPGLAGFAVEAAPTLKTSAATGYAVGVLTGVVDFYTNAGGVIPTGSTSNIVYFDVNGNAVYQPGYSGGAAGVGTCVISCATFGTSYREFFEWCNENEWDWLGAKMVFSEIAQENSNMLIFRKDLSGGTGNLVGNAITPTTYTDPSYQNPLLLEVGVNKPMDRNTSLRYNMQQYSVNGYMDVKMSVYFKRKVWDQSIQNYRYRTTL